MLKQNITRKALIDKNAIKLNVGKDSNEYKVEAIKNSMVYIKKLVGNPSKLNYLIF